MQYLSFFLLLPLFAFANSYYVPKPVVNMYTSPSENTGLASQVIYGEKVIVLENQDRFYKIESEDGYQGWVLKNTILEKENIKGSFYSVKNLSAHIYRVKDTAPFPPIMTLSYGSMVKVLDTKPERWIPIELIDGEKAFIQRGDLELNPKILSSDEVCELSKRFFEVPYTWGGKSSFGYDCSSFLQMLYKHLGLILPRDAYLQAESSLLVSVEKKDLKPGDLLYFGETRIYHNGLYLGDNKFIHATVSLGGPKVAIRELSTFPIKFNCARRPKQDRK